MKALRQFAFMLAMILPLLMPNMACALPGVHLTPAERACCRQMKEQCGSMEMPASHSCCGKELPAMTQWSAVQAPPAHVHLGLSATANLSLIALLQIPANLQGDAPRQSHMLPQSPPATISVLRI